MIARMTIAHVDEVTDVHMSSFEGFFLSFLGPRFLRLYYESIVAYPEATGYVYVRDGRLIGFVCGVVLPSRFYRYLLRTRWWRFALTALGAAIRKPSIVPRLARAWLYPKQTARREDTGTLTSIAVEPAMQNRGIGAELLAAFLEDMRGRGAKSVDLTTDSRGNDKVNAFYRRLGFRCERTFVTPEGREMNEYVIAL
jgi:ribosomal protein S18 acetylase RimI-like enzyme